ncbi:MAG: hypothetical protein JRH15_10335 [Deltaproteobacteria bacterium]|nr:hypothetical protein [Deltaproteobacteria bacterium]
MAFWSVREALSTNERLRRSYYELLRDQLDQFLLQYALVDSYQNFLDRRIPYPFVEKRELKPRARIPDVEYEAQNAFLVIFLEETIPNDCKKYIRYFQDNKTTKTNLLRSRTLPLSDKFDWQQKHLESARFLDFLKMLLPVDYALLIQRDPALKAKDRYSLTHFHVKIDWPITEAAEFLAQSLRYISKDLYEKGDKYAEDIQKKFFEYYGVPVMAGGRRTAAIVAAQYLRRIPCISTVYAGSSESRSLIRLNERGVTKAILIRLSADAVGQICDYHNMTTRSFQKNYVLARYRKKSVCIFQTTYTYTTQARPPDDRKLRDIKPDSYWLTVGSQHILPKPGVGKYPPIQYNYIYS